MEGVCAWVIEHLLPPFPLNSLEGSHPFLEREHVW